MFRKSEESLEQGNRQREVECIDDYRPIHEELEQDLSVAAMESPILVCNRVQKSVQKNNTVSFAYKV